MLQSMTCIWGHVEVVWRMHYICLPSVTCEGVGKKFVAVHMRRVIQRTIGEVAI
jgi:hypothetical protein